jgi:hypothetical protein
MSRHASIANARQHVGNGICDTHQTILLKSRFTGKSQAVTQLGGGMVNGGLGAAAPKRLFPWKKLRSLLRASSHERPTESSYQLALMTPGILPCSASSRKQTRQSLKRRI